MRILHLSVTLLVITLIAMLLWGLALLTERLIPYPIYLYLGIAAVALMLASLVISGNQKKATDEKPTETPETPKKPLTREILVEWNVTRRTAEFFDGTLGNLRVAGLTASITLIGIAFEFRAYSILFILPVLNIALFLIDRRYEEYLGTTAKYAMAIENKYDFNGNGLTYAITAESKRHQKSKPQDIVRIVHFILAATSVGLGLYVFIALYPNLHIFN